MFHDTLPCAEVQAMVRWARKMGKEGWSEKTCSPSWEKAQKSADSLATNLHGVHRSARPTSRWAPKAHHLFRCEEESKTQIAWRNDSSLCWGGKTKAQSEHVNWKITCVFLFFWNCSFVILCFLTHRDASNRSVDQKKSRKEYNLEKRRSVCQEFAKQKIIVCSHVFFWTSERQERGVADDDVFSGVISFATFR